jgi:hypothetical protein
LHKVQNYKRNKEIFRLRRGGGSLYWIRAGWVVGGEGGGGGGQFSTGGWVGGWVGGRPQVGPWKIAEAQGVAPFRSKFENLYQI